MKTVLNGLSTLAEIQGFVQTIFPSDQEIAAELVQIWNTSGHEAKYFEPLDEQRLSSISLHSVENLRKRLSAIMLNVRHSHMKFATELEKAVNGLLEYLTERNAHRTLGSGKEGDAINRMIGYATHVLLDVLESPEKIAYEENEINKLMHVHCFLKGCVRVKKQKSEQRKRAIPAINREINKAKESLKQITQNISLNKIFSQISSAALAGATNAMRLIIAIDHPKLAAISAAESAVPEDVTEGHIRPAASSLGPVLLDINCFTEKTKALAQTISTPTSDCLAGLKFLISERNEEELDQMVLRFKAQYDSEFSTLNKVFFGNLPIILLCDPAEGGVAERQNKLDKSDSVKIKSRIRQLDNLHNYALCLVAIAYLSDKVSDYARLKGEVALCDQESLDILFVLQKKMIQKALYYYEKAKPIFEQIQKMQDLIADSMHTRELDTYSRLSNQAQAAHAILMDKNAEVDKHKNNPHKLKAQKEQLHQDIFQAMTLCNNALNLGCDKELIANFGQIDHAKTRRQDSNESWREGRSQSSPSFSSLSSQSDISLTHENEKFNLTVDFLKSRSTRENAEDPCFHYLVESLSGISSCENYNPLTFVSGSEIFKFYQFKNRVRPAAWKKSLLGLMPKNYSKDPLNQGSMNRFGLFELESINPVASRFKNSGTGNLQENPSYGLGWFSKGTAVRWEFLYRIIKFSLLFDALHSQCESTQQYKLLKEMVSKEATYCLSVDNDLYSFIRGEAKELLSWWRKCLENYDIVINSKIECRFQESANKAGLLSQLPMKIQNGQKEMDDKKGVSYRLFTATHPLLQSSNVESKSIFCELKSSLPTLVLEKRHSSFKLCMERIDQLNTISQMHEVLQCIFSMLESRYKNSCDESKLTEERSAFSYLTDNLIRKYQSISGFNPIIQGNLKSIGEMLNAGLSLKVISGYVGDYNITLFDVMELSISHAHSS